MRAAIFRGAKTIQVEQIPDATLLAPTDAVVQITHACICGTDLWPYRNPGSYQMGWQIGHEWTGIVTDVGAAVRTIKRGDRVIAPYTVGVKHATNRPSQRRPAAGGQAAD